MGQSALMPEFLAELVGTELVAVTFVRRHLVFQSEAPSGRRWTFSAFTLPSVSSGVATHVPGSQSDRDAIVDRSEHRVVKTAASPDELEIAFDDGARLVISLRPEDLVEARVESAFLFAKPSGRWVPGDHMTFRRVERRMLGVKPPRARCDAQSGPSFERPADRPTVGIYMGPSESKSSASVDEVEAGTLVRAYDAVYTTVNVCF